MKKSIIFTVVLSVVASANGMGEMMQQNMQQNGMQNSMQQNMQGQMRANMQEKMMQQNGMQNSMQNSMQNGMQMMGAKTMPLEMVNKMNEDMQLKLKFDYMVNLPILMRAVMKNMDNKELNLSKEQKMALKKHKLEVMDTITPAMQEAHKLSKELKDNLVYGNLSQEDATKLSKKIAQLKESALNMKIVCISFIKQTLSKEQYQTLLSIDKNMPYLNSPYNY